jgi:cellulose synthase/poly-beta-1,6-N-acetylglucosamine synthase-like glycosyltransferase
MKYNKDGAILPRVLLACPTSQRHQHLLDEWIEHLDKLNYPIDVLLVDTSENEDYFSLLKTKKVQEKQIEVIRFPWDCSNHILQHLAHAREKIREFFLENNYEFLMSLDDDVFLPCWGIERLMSYNKDCVGFYYHIYPENQRVPNVMKSGEIIMGKGLEFYSFEEIEAYRGFIELLEANKLADDQKLLIPSLVKDKYFPQLMNLYGVGIGCLLIKRTVLESVPFRTHETFIFGEDLWWINEANDKKFSFWLDCRTRCEHKNTEWESVLKKCPKGMTDFTVAIGPADAKGVDIIKR